MKCNICDAEIYNNAVHECIIKKSKKISNNELYHILNELSATVKKLETKIDKLSGWANVNKKKFNAKEYLDKTTKLSISFQQWLDNLKLTNADLLILFSNNYEYVLTYIIHKYISTIDPIKGFDHMSVLFKYNGSEWIEMLPSDYLTILNKISSEFRKCLKQWEEKNKDMEKFQEIYLKNIKKVNGNEYSSQKTNTILFNELSKHTCLKLKNIIEYEF